MLMATASMADVPMSGKDWSISFPSAAWECRIPPERDTMFTVINPTLRIKVMLVNPRPYLGATKVLTNDIVDYLQDPQLNSQAADTKVISHSLVVINHVEYGRIHVFKTSVNADLFIWVAVHHQLQYQFMCGGAKSDSISNTCDGIAATLKLQ